MELPCQESMLIGWSYYVAFTSLMYVHLVNHIVDVSMSILY